MKEFYTQLIPYFSIRDTKVHNIKSKEFMELENELNIKEEENRILIEKLGQKV